MADAKFLIGDSPQTTQKRFNVPLVVGVNEHVGGEGIVAGSNSPSVNVMHQSYTFHVLQSTTKPVHIQPGRYALQQYAKYLNAHATSSPGVSQSGRFWITPAASRVVQFAASRRTWHNPCSRRDTPSGCLTLQGFTANCLVRRSAGGCAKCGPSRMPLEERRAMKRKPGRIVASAECAATWVGPIRPLAGSRGATQRKFRSSKLDVAGVGSFAGARKSHCPQTGLQEWSMSLNRG